MIVVHSLKTVNELVTSWFPISSQNSLTGGLPSSSSQNSLPGGATFSSCAAERSPRSDHACGEVAGFSGNCSVASSNAMVCLKQVDVPGASLNESASCCGAEKMAKMSGCYNCWEKGGSCKEDSKINTFVIKWLTL